MTSKMSKFLSIILAIAIVNSLSNIFVINEDHDPEMEKWLRPRHEIFIKHYGEPGDIILLELPTDIWLGEGNCTEMFNFSEVMTDLFHCIAWDIYYLSNDEFGDESYGFYEQNTIQGRNIGLIESVSALENMYYEEDRRIFIITGHCHYITCQWRYPYCNMGNSCDGCEFYALGTTDDWLFGLHWYLQNRNHTMVWIQRDYGPCYWKEKWQSNTEIHDVVIDNQHFYLYDLYKR